MDMTDLIRKKGYLLVVQESIVDGIRNGLNVQAAITRRNYVTNVKKNFTTRGNFTTRNIIFSQATGNNLNKMQSEAGATDKIPYMEKHELGEDKTSKSGANLAVPTNDARGGTFDKKVSKRYYLSKIQNRIVKGTYKKNIKSKKARMVAAMAIAHKKNKLVKHNNKIYRVDSFDSSGGKVNAKTRLIYSITKKKARIKKTPSLKMASIKPVQDGPNIMKWQIQKQIKKHGILQGMKLV